MASRVVLIPAGPPAAVEQDRRGTAFRGAALAWGGALLGVALVLALLGAVGYVAAYRGRIHPGVSAFGVDLGGLRQDEAQARLAARLDEIVTGRPVLRIDGQDVPLPAAAFGRPETLASQVSAAASRVGRETPFSRFSVVARAVTPGVGDTALQVPLVDGQAIHEALAAVAQEVDREPVQPVILVERPAPAPAAPAGARAPATPAAAVPERLSLQPGQAGRRLDVERTAADLLAAFGPIEATGLAGTAAPRTVEATFVPLAPALDEAQLDATRKRFETALAQPLTIAVGGKTFPLERLGRLVERIEIVPKAAGSTGAAGGNGTGGAPGTTGASSVGSAGGTGGTADIAGVEFRTVLDEPALASLAAQIAAATSRGPQNARLEARSEEIALVPAVAGETVDAAALQSAIATGLLSGARQVDVQPQPVPARIADDTLAPLRAEANRLIAEPLVLTRGEQRWTLGRAELARLLALPSHPAAPESAPGGASGAAAGAAELRFDEARTRAAIERIAAEGNRPAKNARLEVQGTDVIVLPGEEGEAIDLAATAAAMQGALRAAGPGRAVAVAVKPVASDLTEAKLQAAQAQAARIIGGPLAVRHAGKTWSIPREELAGMLLFGESPAGIVPYLGRTKVLERLQPIANELDPQFEQEYAAALKAWETREAERGAAAAAARETAAQAVADAAAPVAGAAGSQPTAPGQAQVSPARPADDPKPKRRWVDLPATAGALWVQATTDVRVTDLRLTTDDPALGGAAAAGVSAAATGQAAAGRGKWIDVNVTTQSLVAYEGDWPVFNALVSTGLPRTPTPVGTYRIFTKLVADDMRGGSVAAGDLYFLPKVPNVMYFLEGGYAIHGTYWHSNFGNPMSHGCVNLTPAESKWLFDWAPLGTTVVVHR